MKRTLIPFIILVMNTILLIGSAQAASLRCGVHLITEGDPKAKVLAQCGEPDNVEAWEEERVYRFQYPPRYYGYDDNYDYVNPPYENDAPYRIKKMVVVEEWTYNHGPTRFLDHLRLENGIVRRITSGDYGY